MKLDFVGLLNVGAVGVVFAFFMVDFFDTIGTVTGLSAKVGFLDKDGKIPDSEKVLLTDAIGTTLGSVLGTSIDRKDNSGMCNCPSLSNSGISDDERHKKHNIR